MIKVAQCWDDGVCTDIRLIEILHKYNAKATFNLIPGCHGEERQEAYWTSKGYSGWSCRGFIGGNPSIHELGKIYSGFQVASHCMKHECAGKIPDDLFIQSALDGRHFLEDLFQRECHGFAWPCGVYTLPTADALLAAGFEYGRTTQNTSNVSQYEHPMLLRTNCHYQSRAFYDLYQKAKEDGNEFFYFWGHSYEMQDSEGMWKQLEDKIQFISEDPDAVWCDVIDIVRAKTDKK